MSTGDLLANVTKFSLLFSIFMRRAVVGVNIVAIIIIITVIIIILYVSLINIIFLHIHMAKRIKYVFYGFLSYLLIFYFVIKENLISGYYP